MILKNPITYVFVLIFFSLYSCNPQSDKQLTIDYLNESEENFNNRMEWWRNAHFGMFIHWGAYAVPAGIYKGKEVNGIGEWIMNSAQIPITEYEKFASEFNPEQFDAVAWAKAIKNAGMKYVVITSKHHDGFGLWNSRVSHYDIVDFSPYQKDILKLLSEACQNEGIKFGLYYSIMDWHHPFAQAINYPTYNDSKTEQGNPHFNKYLEDYMKPQLQELILNYDPDILWFDGEWVTEFKHGDGLDLYQFVRSLKPSILINNRVDKGRKGMQGMNRTDAKYAGDFGTPEQEILDTKASVDWESCMTMNDTWGYKRDDTNWKSSKELIHNLIDVVSKGGNYLLNVGPKADGNIPTESLNRLQEIGNWMSINSESIYETSPWHIYGEGPKAENTNIINAQGYKEGKDVPYTSKDIRFTKKGDVLYAAIMELPSNNEEIVIKSLGKTSPYIDGNFDNVEMLGGKIASYKFTENGLRLTLIIDEDTIAPVVIKIY